MLRFVCMSEFNAMLLKMLASHFLVFALVGFPKHPLLSIFSIVFSSLIVSGFARVKWMKLFYRDFEMEGEVAT